MTVVTGERDRTAERTNRTVPSALFVVTVFASSALVFMVEPMMARLILPQLGGSAAVWNTSLAFFQMALLAGYVYAHLLQRLRQMGIQIAVHVAILVAACLCLPLHVSGLFGLPSSTEPTLWLLGVLAVSLGIPFAALSATAPLAQAWHARALRHVGAGEPYALYAASNLGSLLALLSYPVLIEPNVGLQTQAAAWSVGYCLFVALIAALGMTVWRAAQRTDQGDRAPALTPGVNIFRERLVWLLLAAAPASLMLGVTNFIATDMGSAPFLWVVPLALYLATFIIAFHRRELVRPAIALAMQAPVLAICALLFWLPAFLPELAIHLLCFFLTALVCNQALVARRPQADRLTDFYVWISIGGVVGGAFNAFVAPLVFSRVIEYPAVLILSCLARPWGDTRPVARDWSLAAVAVASAIAAAFLASRMGDSGGASHLYAFAGLCITALCALLLRKRAALFAGAILVLVISGNAVFNRLDVLYRWRDFFGVLSLYHQNVPKLGDVRILAHGATMHGAQSTLPAYRCRPLTYYAPETPIGQVFTAVEARKNAINIGAVGLGAGSVAAYTRPGDAMRFFEIDPLVIQVATNPAYFSYTTACAKGSVVYTLGDARMTLADQPPGRYDILLIDAFSSDSVPSHLLTVEAVRMYLAKMAPDGVLVLHLSNQHLDLMRPAMAAAAAAGAYALQQSYKHIGGGIQANIWAATETAVIVGKSRAALAPFLSDHRWSAAATDGVAPWTDDYTNIFGALVRHTAERLRSNK
jgi:hypothetical protein